MPFIRGYVTLDKYIKGHTLREMEALLGFNPGKLSAGAQIFALMRLPTNAEFKLAGYSQLDPRKIEPTQQVAKQLNSSGWQEKDIEKSKNMVRNTLWSLSGSNRLVKVVAVNDYVGFKKGTGVPQWELTSDVPATRIASLLNYNDRYL